MITHFIPLEYVIKVHDELIKEYGGSLGILNLGLLKSALEMPKSTFNGKYLHKTIFHKAAAYLFHLAKNHPFVDGNKRTAGIITLLFLSYNNVSFAISDEEYEKIILEVAKGKLDKKEIAHFFKKHSK